MVNARNRLLAVLGASMLAAPGTALPPIEPLDVSWDLNVGTDILVPILDCGPNGCFPDYSNKTCFCPDVDLKYDFGYETLANQEGSTLESGGSTSGGLKDLAFAQGTQTLLWTWTADAVNNEAVITHDIGNAVSITVGNNLYSGALNLSLSMRTSFRLGGLPTDRYLLTLSGLNDSISGSAPTPFGRRPGPYTFRANESINFDYLCPACGLDDDEAATVGDDGVAFLSERAVHQMRVSRNEVGNWIEVGDGLNLRGWALLPRDDSVIAAGTFTTAGGQTVRRIASWNGNAWSPLASGVNGGVLALAEFGDDLIIGGGFTEAANGSGPMLRVGRWDGNSWSPMGQGFNGIVRALAVVDGVLYAGGDFTASGTTQLGRIARWSTATQSWVSVGMFDAPVHALMAFGSGLLAGGDFTEIDGTQTRGLALYDGAWSEPAAVVGSVRALAPQVVRIISPFDPEIYNDEPAFVVGGAFTSGEATNIGVVAPYYSSDMRALGSGVDGMVNAVYVHEPGPFSVVIAGGEFSNAGGQPAANIARWDRDRWSAMSDGLDGFVTAMTVYNNELVAVGEFTMTGPRLAEHFARFTLDTPTCAGDANGDFLVNFADLNLVLTQFGQTGTPGSLDGDLNGDGAVNFADLNLLLSAFGAAC